MKFLYCFDKNYNFQGITSINSLISSSTLKLSIYIIHEDPESIQKSIFDINQNNLHEIKIYKFKKQSFEFPRVKGTHVSDATYYRLFISEYLPEDIDFITYIDADIICIKSPIDAISKTINLMKKNNLSISATTESVGRLEDISRLNLKQEKYFNAGVLVINFQSWNKKNKKNEFINNLNKIKEKILWWDQDVLNYTYDGEYLELSNLLNYQIEINNNFDTKKIDEEVIFLHYLGNTKPWSFSGLENNYSKYYQTYFRKISEKKYHLVSKNLKQDFFKFIKLIIFDFKNIEYKFAFIQISLNTLFLNFIKKISQKINK